MAPELLLLYIVGSAAAIGLLALLQHLLGRTRSLTLSDAQEARDIFAEDYADARVEDILISRNARAALLAVTGGATGTGAKGVGLVRSMGSKWTCTLLIWGDIARVRDMGKGRLVIRPRSFTQTTIRLRFPEDTDLEPWVTRLSQLARAEV